ncbi:MAG: ABC transporter ATP-binding protein [Acidobacteriota bacterium]
MSQDRPIIQLENLRRVFHAAEVETHALSGIQLSVQPGEFLSISGPSGSGKTTLLSILGLLDAPSSGRYLLDGREVGELRPIDRARLRGSQIGFIFQSFNLIGDLTVEDNVELALSYQSVPVDERRPRVKAALERVGMAHRARHFPSQLSGGQQQRVAVARAIVGKPLVLLADEPTGNLDSANGEAVIELLKELHAEGATICMVTHNPEYAEMADRDIQLFDGRIVDESRRQALEAVR